LRADRFDGHLGLEGQGHGVHLQVEIGRFADDGESFAQHGIADAADDDGYVNALGSAQHFRRIARRRGGDDDRLAGALDGPQQFAERQAVKRPALALRQEAKASETLRGASCDFRFAAEIAARVNDGERV
jgi:hypothetical protein